MDTHEDPWPIQKVMYHAQSEMPGAGKPKLGPNREHIWVSNRRALQLEL